MTAKDTVVVISDLHMGAGALDDFETEIEQHLIAFLEHWRGQNYPVELVVNGDLLDFVQAPQVAGRELEGETAIGVPLCFTEEQSLAKLEAIHDAHRASFRAFGDFLAAGEKTLTILPGNHDPDFFWPMVRRRFIDLVESGGHSSKCSVNFNLEHAYRPPMRPDLYIEHGHQFDPINSFFVGDYACWSESNQPILKANDGKNRLFECIGTRFLIRYLNSLDAQYPYVDNVKPFSVFLQLFGASALRGGMAPLKATIAVGAMLRFLAQSLIRRPSDLLEIEPTGTSTELAVLRDVFNAATSPQKEIFKEAISASGFRLQGPLKIILSDPESGSALLEHMSEHLELADLVDDTEEAGVLELAHGFAVNETDDLGSAAAAILENPQNDCRFVVMGHTHEPVRSGTYLNTGSWTRCYRGENEARTCPWSMLRSKSYERFPYELNFAVARAGDPETILETFAKTIEA